MLHNSLALMVYGGFVASGAMACIKSVGLKQERGVD